MAIRPLQPGEEGAAYDFLARDPWANVMMMAVLRDWGSNTSKVREFYVFEQHGTWKGIASFARDIALYGSRESMRAFASIALKRQPVPSRIISPKNVVDVFWQGFQQGRFVVHFDRLQTLYRLFPHELSSFSCQIVKSATLSELDLLVASSAAMNLEELGIDPLGTEEKLFRSRVQGLIDRKRLYCIVDEKGVVFQAAIHSQTPLSAQIAGVYTRPDCRGQGIAKRALAEVCRTRFSESVSCCLFVNDFNQSARAVYDKIGFQKIGAFRAIFLEER